MPMFAELTAQKKYNEYFCPSKACHQFWKEHNELQGISVL